MADQAKKLKEQRKQAVLKRMEKMSPLEKVSFIISNQSSYALFDKELCKWYIQELIKMNGGTSRFKEMLPGEIGGNVIESWSAGRRQPTPFVMRLLVGFLENKIGRKVRDTDSFALRQKLDKMEEAYLDIQDKLNEKDAEHQKEMEKFKKQLTKKALAKIEEKTCEATRQAVRAEKELDRLKAKLGGMLDA